MQTAGLVCTITGQHADAGAIALHAPSLVPLYARTAEQYEPLGKLLDYFTTTGPLAEIAFATLPFVMQILANHKIVKPVAAMGVLPPEALAADIRAGLARQQAEALAKQEAAEAELRAMIDQQNNHVVSEEARA
jgi:hypothetical protein